MSDDADVKTLLGESAVVRAHAGAAGAPAPGQALPPHRALGRSRGGFSTKIHCVVNGIGQPLRALLTPGQAAEAPQVPFLFAQLAPDFAILDNAYDTEAVLAFFERQGTIPVIPPKANRVVQRDYDRQLLDRAFHRKAQTISSGFFAFRSIGAHLICTYPLRLCINLVTIERQHSLEPAQCSPCPPLERAVFNSLEPILSQEVLSGSPYPHQSSALS